MCAAQFSKPVDASPPNLVSDPDDSLWETLPAHAPVCLDTNQDVKACENSLDVPCANGNECVEFNLGKSEVIGEAGGWEELPDLVDGDRKVIR